MVALNFGQHKMLGQPLAETPEMLRKRRLAEGLIVSLAEAIADLDAAPFTKVRVECYEGHYDLIIEKRSRVSKPAA